MKLKHVEVFNAIMVAGTVSGAARLLNVTQPAITQTLQHAELRLGFDLFRRVKNRLVPTRAALMLYPEIERLFGQLESVRSLAHNLRRGDGQELRIIIVPSLAVHLLPLALKSFRKKYPDIPLSIRTLHSKDTATAIALREADVGIIYGSQVHPAIEGLPIATGHMVCLLPKSVPPPQSIALHQLSGQPVIRIYPQDPLGLILNELCSRLEISLDAGITVQTHHTALCLAEHGFGPAIVDVFTAACHQTGELDVVMLEPELPVHLTALKPREEQEVVLSNYFIECVQQAAREIVKKFT